VSKHTVGFLALLTGVLAVGAIPVAHADEVGRFSAIEENDLFAPDNHDQHYTQGARLSYLSGDLAPNSWAAPPSFWGLFEGGKQTTSRHFDIAVEQDIFTPRDKTRANPDPRDRPYAGWLHLGLGWIQDTDKSRLDHLGIEIGMIGPSSQAAQAQNRFHLAIDVAQAQGWAFQLHDEVAGTIDYERSWRVAYHEMGGVAFDAIPEAGMTLGNVYDYAEAGGRLRFGKNLLADYGPGRIAPGPSGTDYFNPDYLAEGDPIIAYGFVGVQGRAVGRNIFLDGNSFQASRSVTKKNFVGDAEIGFVLGFSEFFRVSYSYLLRSQEFEHQHGPDHFGSLMASLVLPF
jgi:lipid A 3-O-deacylase